MPKHLPSEITLCMLGSLCMHFVWRVDQKMHWGFMVIDREKFPSESTWLFHCSHPQKPQTIWALHCAKDMKEPTGPAPWDLTALEIQVQRQEVEWK